MFALGFLVWFGVKALPPLSGVALRLSAPIWGAGNHAELAASIGIKGLSSGVTLAAENEVLKHEILALKDERILRETELRSYNELLVRFGRSLDTAQGVLAGVLSTPPRSLYDTIIIDAGSSSGVHEGMIAYTDAGTPIGEVIRTSSIASVVELFSSPGKRMDVVIGTGTVRAVAEGRGGQNMVARLPRDAKIAVGDAVTVPSLTGDLVGNVAGIDVLPTDSFQTIRFVLNVSLSDLRFVMVREHIGDMPLSQGDIGTPAAPDLSNP